MNTVVRRAYPENHSVWDKIVCPASLTLKEFSAWLSSQHKLQLVSWDFIYGYKSVYDEEAKKKVSQCVSAPIYPPKPALNYSLLPPLDISMAEVKTE